MAELDVVSTNVCRQIAQVCEVLRGFHPQGKPITALRLDNSIPSRSHMTLSFCHRVQVQGSHVVYTLASHDETMDNIFDSSYKQRVRRMQSGKASEDIARYRVGHKEYVDQMVYARISSSSANAGRMIQTRLVHHMPIESQGDPVSLTIVHHPHRSNHRTEANKLHR